MKVVVVAHVARAEQAKRLAAPLGAHVFMDDQGRGAAWGHLRALQWAAAQAERVVVLEDDAEPVAGFLGHAGAWCERYPCDLLSFYLGTGRPPQWQGEIKRRLRQADCAGEDRIVLPELVHGVAYSLPAGAAGEVLKRLNPMCAIDFAVGRAWRALSGRAVVYPVRSLVEHADGPSIERHPDGRPRTETRRAWRLLETP